MGDNPPARWTLSGASTACSKSRPEPPEAVAVEQGQSLTYRSWMRGQIGSPLPPPSWRRPGVVGLCLERSIELIVGLLGILKSGGAYSVGCRLSDRTVGVHVADSQVRVLMTQQDQLVRLPATNAHSICLDSEWAQIAKVSRQCHRGTDALDNLAYVIYVRSTGHPKG